jgi:putative ABC transport system permease protein
MIDDLKFAFRQCLKNLGSTMLAVLILALGIGGNTAIFSVADKVLLNPIPGRDADRLITVFEVNARSGFHWRVSPPLIRELASLTNLIESLTYFVQVSQKKMEVGEETLTLRGAKVSPNFFGLLGIRPLTGRSFLPDEGGRESGNVMVISHGFWQQHFGGVPEIIGKTTEMEGVAYTIIGMMPPNIQFPGQNQFWVPQILATDELTRPWEPEEATWNVIGRLRKGVALYELQSRLDSLAARWLQELQQPNQRWKFQVGPARQYFTSPTLEKTLWSLQAMVGALLLIACANVGNLLLSRALSRRGEFGIRLAIGAGRLRIARQLFIENLSLAVPAAALGVFFGWGGIIALEHFYLSGLPRLNPIRVDWSVVGMTCLIAVAAGVSFGAAPAWLATRVNLNESLKETAQQHSGGFLQRAVHDGFVVLQVSLAVVLLAGAGMMIHSVVKLLQVYPGLNPKGLYSVVYDINPVLKSRLDLDEKIRGGLSRQEAINVEARWKVRQFYNWQELILERLQAIPGVEAAAVKAEPGGGLGCQVEGRSDLVQLDHGIVSVRKGDYFRTIGAPLVAGRFLAKEDCVPGEPTIVINERLAEACWPGQVPLGKKLSRPSPPPRIGFEPERVVVGVVRNIRDYWRDEEARPAYYEPFERMAPEGETGGWFSIGNYVFRTRLDPAVFRGSLVRLGQEMSPGVEIVFLNSVEADLYRSTAPRRIMMWLLITLGGLGLLMSALGVYAVMSYSVARRTREVSVRMALGAGSDEIRNLFFRHGARLIVNGMVLGVVVAVTVGQYVESLLFGVTPADPWAFAGILLILGFAAGIACWLPARRAARVDPMVALRCE